jgi:hypothetical protein
LPKTTSYCAEVQLAFGRPFRAGLVMGSYPGLKPWTVLSDHFVINNRYYQ